MAALEKCDFRGCGNLAYREVDYFKDREFRDRTAREITHLSKEESALYLQRLVRARATAWSFLCRKHFTQEAEAGRIISWCGILTGRNQHLKEEEMSKGRRNEPLFGEHHL